MVVALSYIFAVIITVALAIILYPIAAFFWILGIFGRLAEVMFAFTQKTISSLWSDLGNVKKSMPNETINHQIVESNTTSWVCACGTENIGHFCSVCGASLEANSLWMCECGSVNKTNFCTKCGKKK